MNQTAAVMLIVLGATGYLIVRLRPRRKTPGESGRTVCGGCGGCGSGAPDRPDATGCARGE